MDRVPDTGFYFLYPPDILGLGLGRHFLSLQASEFKAEGISPFVAAT